MHRFLEVAHWPEIWKNVWEYYKNCPTCQQYKHRISKLANAKHSGHGTRIYVGSGPDGSISTVNRLKRTFVVLNYCSKWVELCPLRTASASVIGNLLVKEIFTRWAVPAYLVSDRGPQFTLQVLNYICRQWGVIQKLTTAHHPQTNLTEKNNQIF